VPLSFSNPSLNATVDTNLITFELLGVTLGFIPGYLVGETEDLIVKGDITFVGAVPEPGTGSLLGSESSGSRCGTPADGRRSDRIPATTRRLTPAEDPVQLRFVSLVLALASACGFAATATASPIVGGGLATSIACPNGSSPCSTAADFSLSPPTPVKPATGSITFSGGTATILLNVASYTMTGSSGSVTALDIHERDLLGHGADHHHAARRRQRADQPGARLRDGFGVGHLRPDRRTGCRPVLGHHASFSNLSCLLNNGNGQCGFNVGSVTASADFALDVDGASHDVVQTFNVIVPEPGSLGLVLLGGVALVAYARRARKS
jgi:hypothetical protein